jgi:glucarate dehydratase
MKLIDMRVRTVAIPLNAQLRHNTGVHPGYLLRTVLGLITDEGIVGLGEVGGGDQRATLTKLKPRIIGMDPFNLEAIKLKVLRSIYYLSNSRLYGAIEIACLDINGAIAVPEGPGLGVELDEDKMKHYEKYFEEKGDYYARFHEDPRRPDWYPIPGQA